jgi:hypothetical protein
MALRFALNDPPDDCTGLLPGQAHAGVDIALLAFVPPVVAAIPSFILAYGHVPVIAYISGTLGTLIGADLLKIRKKNRCARDAGGLNRGSRDI